MSTRWFHRTCAHGAERIERDGMLLRPHAQVMLGRAPLVWLTCDRSASAAALGLGGHAIVTCDRMEHLFEVVPEDTDKVVWWSAYKAWPECARLVPQMRLLEGAHGSRPALWAVSADPLRVVRG